MTINTAAHKNILIRVLKDIFTDLTIATHLGFKGGTAAMLFYGLDRFSVDLDFDLLDDEKDQLVFEKIRAILMNYGTITEENNKRYNIIFIFSYEGKFENEPNIKVEIDKRFFGSRYEIKNYLGIAMQIMVKEDMVANKLVAMHERIGKTNRDIYDVWFFFHNNWTINKQIVELRTNMPYKNFLEVCIDDLEKMSNRNILNGIGELLNPKQQVWVKEKLLPETIFLLKSHKNLTQ